MEPAASTPAMNKYTLQIPTDAGQRYMFMTGNKNAGPPPIFATKREGGFHISQIKLQPIPEFKWVRCSRNTVKNLMYSDMAKGRDQKAADEALADKRRKAKEQAVQKRQAKAALKKALKLKEKAEVASRLALKKAITAGVKEQLKKLKLKRS